MLDSWAAKGPSYVLCSLPKIKAQSGPGLAWHGPVKVMPSRAKPVGPQPGRAGQSGLQAKPAVKTKITNLTIA